MTRAVSRLKLRKAVGPDGLMAEHLRAAGVSPIIWLMNVLHSAVELEAVPDILKKGILIPVYKGGGKDPLLVDSYRGITLTPTFEKALEFLVLGTLTAVFSEAGVPHINQTAYRKKVSCADAIFVTQEVIAKFLDGGDEVFMCLYELCKAFDSVEYPVLLTRLREADVVGRSWRIIRDWYAGGKCRVKLGGRDSLRNLRSREV